MDFAPGIHFGLDEDDYHTVPALSSSGVKNIRMSPLDFWARAPWLNPDYEDDNEETEDTIFQILGRAYHKRILEGREAFTALYAPKLEQSDLKDLLVTMDDLRGELIRLELPKTCKNKAEAIARILAANPTARIWDVIEDGYIKSHPGKTFLPRRTLDKIELSAAMIEKDPALAKAFTGGMPEVSIFWTCPAIGIPCKARFDYLKPKAIVDLKTFANKSGYPIDRAVARELAYNRYPIQASWYYDAADQIAGLMNAGKVYGDAPHNYLSALHANHEKTFIYVFQQKGVAPLAIGKSFPRSLTNCLVAAAHCEGAKQTYRQCLETFGRDPWLVPRPITAMDDTEIPFLWE